MGKDAASIIRSIDPAAKIISPSAHGPTMKTWFDGYVAAGGAANFDIVNAHLRGSKNPSNSSPVGVPHDVGRRHYGNREAWPVQSAGMG